MIKYKLMCKKNLFCLELIAAASIFYMSNMDGGCSLRWLSASTMT